MSCELRKSVKYCSCAIWKKAIRFFKSHRLYCNWNIFSTLKFRNSFDSTTKFPLEINVPEPPRSRWKSLLYVLCGLGDTNDEENNVFRGSVIIEQSKTVKRILRANSLFLILLSAILIIYFTVPDGGPTAPTIDLPYMPFVLNGTRP